MATKFRYAPLIQAEAPVARQRYFQGLARDLDEKALEQNKEQFDTGLAQSQEQFNATTELQRQQIAEADKQAQLANTISTVGLATQAYPYLKTGASKLAGLVGGGAPQATGLTAGGTAAGTGAGLGVTMGSDAASLAAAEAAGSTAAPAASSGLGYASVLAIPDIIAGLTGHTGPIAGLFGMSDKNAPPLTPEMYFDMVDKGTNKPFDDMAKSYGYIYDPKEQQNQLYAGGQPLSQATGERISDPNTLYDAWATGRGKGYVNKYAPQLEKLGLADTKNMSPSINLDDWFGGSA